MVSPLVSAAVIGRVLGRIWEPAVRTHLASLTFPLAPNQPRDNSDCPPRTEQFCAAP